MVIPPKHLKKLKPVFRNMRGRCELPSNTSYPRYGAKGIKCLWVNFEDFLQDMYPSFVEHVEVHGERNTTIDRKDSKGNYEKSNCRWSTYKVQNNNKSNNVLITYKGETHSLPDWAKKLNLNLNTVLIRYSRGWSTDRMFLSERQNRYGKFLVFELNGKKQSLRDWAKDLNVKYPTLYWRIIIKNKPLEEALKS